MRSAFELRLSTDAPYRALAAEVAGKAAELAGGAEADARIFCAEVTAAVEDLAAGSETLLFRFVAEDGRIEVVVEGAGRSRTVQRSISARKD